MSPYLRILVFVLQTGLSTLPVKTKKPKDILESLYIRKKDMDTYAYHPKNNLHCILDVISNSAKW